MDIKELLQYKIRTDTLFAAAYFFNQSTGGRYTVAPFHRMIAEALDRVFEGKCNRLIINLPPRFGKTELVVKTFIEKGLAINPASRFIHLSYSASLALDNSERAKDVVTSDWYQELFPYVQIKKDSKSKQKWYTTAGGGVYATSSAGQVTGFGAGGSNSPSKSEGVGGRVSLFSGAIIIDDPLKPEDAFSPAIRQKVNDRFENTIRSRVNSKDTPIIIIMQRLHRDDLTGYLLNAEKDTWEVLSLPALQIAADGKKTSLFPQRYNVEDLEHLESLNKYVFEAQYQQNPLAINDRLWLFAFDRAKHCAPTTYNNAQPLYVSFDFNRDPITASLWQHYNGFIYGIDTIRLQNATTRMVCQELERRYPNAFLIITGDCAGKGRTTMSLLNNYDEIKAYFRLSRSQMQYDGSNPRLADSRYFMNSIFEKANIQIDPERCKPLIFDFENVMSDEENRPVKSSRENAAQQSDFLDNARYYFHRYYRQFVF